jgi:DNA-binding MarR family transcriptional regulator
MSVMTRRSWSGRAPVGATNQPGFLPQCKRRCRKSLRLELPIDRIAIVLYSLAVNKISPPSIAPASLAGTPDSGVPLIFQILGAARELQTRLDDALDEIGLSPGKVGVLRALAKAGEPLPLSELAECNKCVRSNVTQLVDRLEADGLVRRIDDPDDRRVTRASLTAEGRKSYLQATKVIEHEEREILRVLNAEEAGALVRVLEQLTSSSG